MSGYSGTPLSKKLGINAGHRIALLNKPPAFREYLGALPEKSTFVATDADGIDVIIWFVRSSRELTNTFPSIAKRLTPTGILWVGWPKKSSGVETDLAFDVVQKTGLAAGLVDTKICAIDETWSGLKFVYRLADREQIKGRG